MLNDIATRRAGRSWLPSVRRQGGAQVGVSPELHQLLHRPKARAGIDGVLTVDYGDDADPASLLARLELPGGLENYDRFSDPKIIADLEQARGTADPDRRAAVVARAEELTMQELPWIPDVQPNTVLVLSKGVTGAVASFDYLFAPWVNSLGGTG